MSFGHLQAGKESAPAKEAFKKQPASCKVGKNTSESTQSSSSTSGSLKHCKLNDTEQVCSSNLTGQVQLRTTCSYITFCCGALLVIWLLMRPGAVIWSLSYTPDAASP